MVCLGVGILFAALGALSAIREGRAKRARWGHVRRATEPRGPGAFRAAALTERRPRGVPATVWAAGAIGRAFAVFGPVVGTPALLVLALAAASDPFFGRAGLSLAAVVGAVGMLGHASFTASSAGALLRCERRAGERAKLVGGGAALGSALVLGALGLGDGLSAGAGWWAAALLAGSALSGVALWIAGARVEAIQSAMTDAEWDALPLDL